MAEKVISGRGYASTPDQDGGQSREHVYHLKMRASKAWWLARARIVPQARRIVGQAVIRRPLLVWGGGLAKAKDGRRQHEAQSCGGTGGMQVELHIMCVRGAASRARTTLAGHTARCPRLREAGRGGAGRAATKSAQGLTPCRWRRARPCPSASGCVPGAPAPCPRAPPPPSPPVGRQEGGHHRVGKQLWRETARKVCARGRQTCAPRRRRLSNPLPPLSWRPAGPCNVPVRQPQLRQGIAKPAWTLPALPQTQGPAGVRAHQGQHPPPFARAAGWPSSGHRRRAQRRLPAHGDRQPAGGGCWVVYTYRVGSHARQRAVARRHDGLAQLAGPPLHWLMAAA